MIMWTCAALAASGALVAGLTIGPRRIQAPADAIVR